MSRGPAALTALALVAIGLGLWAAGSPQAARLARLDTQRSAALGAIADRLRCQAGETGSLPDRIEPDAACGLWSGMTDPVTGAPYAWTRDSPTTGRLCADFALPHGRRPPQIGEDGCLTVTIAD